MQFPVVLHKDKNSDYGVTVPDLPGCFSAGQSVDEALAMAKEAIELYLEQTIEDGKPVPLPGRIEKHQRNSDYRGGVWAFVSVDQSTLRVAANWKSNSHLTSSARGSVTPSPWPRSITYKCSILTSKKRRSTHLQAMFLRRTDSPRMQKPSEVRGFAFQRWAILDSNQ